MELVLAALLGILGGIITGLAPGIHVNLVATLLWSALPWIPFSPLALAIFIISVATTHTFLDAIPTVFLGAPDSASALSALPGHRYLLRGMGVMAVKLSTLGALAGLVFGLAVFPLFTRVTAVLEEIPKHYIGIVLLSIPLIMLFRERKRWAAALVIVLASGLGVVGFRYSDPLFPMLTGLFGVSMLLASLREKVSIPEQQFLPVMQLRWRDAIRAMAGGLIAGGLTAVLPGLGAAHAAVVGMVLAMGTGDHGFLILTGTIGTTNFFLSLAAYAAVEKARNGALLTATALAPNIPIMAAIGAALFAGGVGFVLTLRLARTASTFLPRIPYQTLSWTVIGTTSVLVVVLNGLSGVGLLIAATAIGTLTATAKCARAHAMSCILVPVGLRFLGLPV
jgi:putative membrane protein